MKVYLQYVLHLLLDLEYWGTDSTQIIFHFSIASHRCRNFAQKTLLNEGLVLSPRVVIDGFFKVL